MAHLNNQLTKLAWFGFGDDEPVQPSATDLAFDSVRKAITDEHKEKFNAAAESAADRSTLIGAGLGAGAGAGLSGAYAVGSSLKGGKLGSRLWNLVTNKGSNVSRTSRIANKLWNGRSLKGKAGLIAAPVLAMLGGGYLNRKLSQGQSDSMRESMFGPQVQAAAEEAVQKEASFGAAANTGYLAYQLEKLASAVEAEASNGLPSTGNKLTDALADGLGIAGGTATASLGTLGSLYGAEKLLKRRGLGSLDDVWRNAKNMGNIAAEAAKAKNVGKIGQGLARLGSTTKNLFKGKAALPMALLGLGAAGATGLAAYGTPKAIRNWRTTFGAPDNSDN